MKTFRTLSILLSLLIPAAAQATGWHVKTYDQQTGQRIDSTIPDTEYTLLDKDLPNGWHCTVSEVISDTRVLSCGIRGGNGKILGRTYDEALKCDRSDGVCDRFDANISLWSDNHSVSVKLSYGYREY